MKTLIYAMQSSGASLFTYWMAQQDNCISIIDLYYNQLAPKINHENVIIKAVVSNAISLDQHKNSFEPDKVVLFIRNPIQNHLSLCEKSYADFGGSVEEKLQILDQCLTSEKFDNIIKYENFIMKDELKIGEISYYNFNKTIEQIIKYNNLNNEWCKLNYKKKWSIGNIHENYLNVMECQKYLPNLCKLYKRNFVDDSISFQ